MRIGLIVPGGVDRSGRMRVVPVFLNLIERLARRHSVCVFALHQEPGHARYDLRGATVVNLGQTLCLPTGARFADRFVRLVGNIVRESPRFDLLHALFASEPGALAAAAGRLLGIPVVTSVLGGECIHLPEIEYGGRHSFRGRHEVKFALRYSQKVTAPSWSAVQQCTRADTEYVVMGVDCNFFSPASSIPAGPPWRLLHVGSLNRVKDQRTLLRAVQLVANDGLDVVLDVVGEDTLNGEVQRIASALGLGERVLFRGFLPNDEVAELYRRSHLYVHSSLHETIPVSALEAAACSVPLVGTAVGIFRELAPEGAMAVAPGDPAALANAMMRVLRDDALRARLAKAALAFARQYDADWTAQRFEQLYASCVTTPTAVARAIQA